ncbi:MAG TPA: rhomboid family protein [Terriglobia bacterium]|nr:rhomboid family protein [Terriglobia bacterium]
MSAILRERCFNHGQREAAARCPGCRRSFCRECVTEHESRVLCATCLKKLAERASTRRSAWPRLGRASGVVLGTMSAWFFFYLVGAALLRLTDTFHETSIWQVPWLRQ